MTDEVGSQFVLPCVKQCNRETRNLKVFFLGGLPFTILGTSLVESLISLFS